MKIALTTQGPTWDDLMDPRFGRTQFFFVYDEECDEVETFDNSAINNEAHGAGPRTAQKLIELGAAALITGNGPGGNAARVLDTTGIEVYIGAGEFSVRQAYEAYKAGSLTKT
jgi:predicted Fe-Mo cluster-binding NifX family protein